MTRKGVDRIVVAHNSCWAYSSTAAVLYSVQPVDYLGTKNNLTNKIIRLQFFQNDQRSNKFRENAGVCVRISRKIKFWSNPIPEPPDRYSSHGYPPILVAYSVLPSSNFFTKSKFQRFGSNCDENDIRNCDINFRSK